LVFDTNRHKFESLLQSIVTSRLLRHKLPGNAHVSASSEGFERRAVFEELSAEHRKGIVWINGYQGELKPTFVKTKDGKEVISRSQVLIRSHFKVRGEDGKSRYIDLSSDQYSEDITSAARWWALPLTTVFAMYSSTPCRSCRNWGLARPIILCRSNWAAATSGITPSVCHPRP